MVCEFEDLQNQDKAGYDVEGGLLLVCNSFMRIRVR
jgi:hypothetical protein